MTACGRRPGGRPATRSLWMSLVEWPTVLHELGLGCSQLLSAWAAEDMKSRNWLDSHQRMYAFYGGVPHVTVPDCLKQGALKCHGSDPDLNPSYAALTAHYATAVVPARPPTRATRRSSRGW